MKKAYLLFAIMALSFVSAQESYPNKHPELLLNKDVKVISTHYVETFGVSRMYTDPGLSFSDLYMPKEKNSSYTKKEALLGREFKVIGVDSVEVYNKEKTCMLTLLASDGLKLYHNYIAKSYIDYPFEVIGGLTLPEGFYCDYITIDSYRSVHRWSAIVEYGFLSKEIRDGKEQYAISFVFFGKKASAANPITSVTYVFDNGATIVDNAKNFYPQYHDTTTSKYSFTTFIKPEEMKLYLGQKLVGVKVGDVVFPVVGHEKAQGILKCMQSLK